MVKKEDLQLYRCKSLIIKMVVGDGFEPSKDVLADLQSANLSLFFYFYPLFIRLIL